MFLAYHGNCTALNLPDWAAEQPRSVRLGTILYIYSLVHVHALQDVMFGVEMSRALLPYMYLARGKISVRIGVTIV